MRKLMYTLLELKRESRKVCDFCSNLYGGHNKSVNEIITRREEDNELISADAVCENCKEKFFNDEIPRCERCGRLQNRHYIDVLSGKNVCYCIKYNEDIEEKELPSLPHERESMTTFYERQINALQEKESQLTEEVDTHLEALEIAEDWHKRQKQELLDRIAKLEEENKQLREEKKVELYEKEIERLKKQLEQTAQIEVPAKENKIRSLFKFGSK